MSRATRKIRVFVVEDHPAIARGLQMFLEAVGFSVELTFDMQSALAALPKTKFDVLLCDLALPDGTGWELMKELTKSGPVPAIAFSAFDDPEDVERSRNAGFAEHVAKGAPAEQLVEAIERTARAGVPIGPAFTRNSFGQGQAFPVPAFTALVSPPNEQVC